MSGGVAVPKGLLKNSVIGALVALVCYVMLQFLSALLIHIELAGEGALYPMVCVSAGLSAFLGCGYSVMKRGVGSVLSASAVVLVFLVLTVAVALMIGEIGGGLTGVGGAMAAGGLASAVVPGLWDKKRKGRRDGRRTRKTRK